MKYYQFQPELVTDQCMYHLLLGNKTLTLTKVNFYFLSGGLIPPPPVLFYIIHRKSFFFLLHKSLYNIHMTSYQGISYFFDEALVHLKKNIVNNFYLEHSGY